jgi:hypothetical protein
MAVSGLIKAFGTSMEITEAKYDALVREREQLRILKNFIKLESTLTKGEVLNLIAAMEVKNE